MAPLAIIAGIPRHTCVNSSPHYTYVPAGTWQISFAHAEGRQPDLDRSWNELLSLIEAVEADEDHEGVHVLAFHKNDRTRARFVDRIGPYHRLRFLDRNMLAEYGTSRFSGYIDRVLQEETLWRERVRPDGRSHPLVLPEQYFAVPNGLKHAWINARTANSERDADAVAQMIVGFERYRRTNAFEDIKGRLFTYNGPCHGKPKYIYENWKLARRLLTDMQYDVSVSAGGALMLTVDGRTISFSTHANVSPHGVVFGPFKKK